MFDKTQKIWKELLESALTTKLEKRGFVLFIGPPNSEKHSLLGELARLTAQKENGFERSLGGQPIDFAFLAATRGDEKEEIGKINFYIVDETRDFLFDFFDSAIFDNFLLIVSVDIARPENIENDFRKSFEFAQRLIARALEASDAETRTAIRNALAAVAKRVELLGARFAEPSLGWSARLPSTGEATEPLSTESETAAERRTNDEKPKSETAAERQTNDEKPKSDISELQSAVRPALLILANNSAQLDTLRDERLVEHIVYTLRNLAIVNSASLAFVDAESGANVEPVLELLTAALFEQPSDGLAPRFAPKRFFCLSGADSPAALRRDFPAYVPYVFKPRLPAETETRGGVKAVEEFFQSLSCGQFEFFKELSSTGDLRVPQPSAPRLSVTPTQKPLSITERMRILLERKANA